jgi:hypothetical protein
MGSVQRRLWTRSRDFSYSINDAALRGEDAVAWVFLGGREKKGAAGC